MRLSAPIYRLKRQAKRFARHQNIPLHQALDRIAVGEGFRSWSHLASAAATTRPARTLLDTLSPGDLLLVGARPGHGKTLLGLEMALAAPTIGRHATVFTLNDNEADVRARLAALAPQGTAQRDAITIDTSDDICAAHIMARLSAAAGPSLAVVDYLQLLDQKRSHPDLSNQIKSLKSYAEAQGSILVMISQIDRAFERTKKRIPDLGDVRLPNPIDLSVFHKTCFLHDGAMEIHGVA
ncbi:MAG: DNA helicase [Pseudomonadota bacterium]